MSLFSFFRAKKKFKVNSLEHRFKDAEQLPTRALLQYVGYIQAGTFDMPTPQQWIEKVDVHFIKGFAPERVIQQAAFKEPTVDPALQIHDALMSTDIELNSITEMLHAYHNAQSAEQLFILGELFFSLENWLGSVPPCIISSEDEIIDINRLRQARRPAVNNLFFSVCCRLLELTTATTAEEIPQQLAMIFGKGLTDHGSKVDLYCSKQNRAYYLSAAQRDKFRLRFTEGLAYQLPWWEKEKSAKAVMKKEKGLRLADSRLIPGVDARHNSWLESSSSPKMFLEGFCGCVMNLQRDFFCAQHRGAFKKYSGVKNFFHSSYFSGSTVAFAGSLRIIDGVITGICNDSGHYKPPVENILIALHALKYHGVDLSKIEVFSMVKQTQKVQLANGTTRNQSVWVKKKIAMGDTAASLIGRPAELYSALAPSGSLELTEEDEYGDLELTSSAEYG